MFRSKILWRVIGSSVLFAAAGIYSAVDAPKPAHALPVYARQYGVSCATCHTVAPALNDFGQAFLANHFNWPGGHAPGQSSRAGYVPISGLTTMSSFDDISNRATTTEFNTQELFATGGFTLAPNAHGGYFADYFLATNGTQAGGLGDAYVTLPIDAARHRALLLTVGQDTPLSYQYEENNSLSIALPAALSSGVDGFSLLGDVPMLRLEYADGTGHRDPGGSYIAVGVPFAGSLTTNNQSRLYDTSEGYFLHAYIRHGQNSLGAFGFVHTASSLEGILATSDLSDKLHILGALQTGSDQFLGVGSAESLEADYYASPEIGLTMRLDNVSGSGAPAATFPVATLTYYPFKQTVVRLTAETVQEKAARSSAIYLLIQL